MGIPFTRKTHPYSWAWQWPVYYLLSLMLITGAAWAQGPPLPLARTLELRDSISQLLTRDRQPDTLRVHRLNILSFALRFNEPAQSLAWARQALALARHLRFQSGVMEAQFNLGYYFRAHSQYDSALYFTKPALELAARTGNRYTQSRAFYNLTRIYQEQGNYAAALGTSLDGLALARALGTPRVLLFQLVMAARLELALGEYDNARAYVAEARPLAAAAHDLLSAGYLHQVVGDLHRHQGQWLAARQAYAQALASYAVVMNKQGQIYMELSIAEMDERLGDYPAARRAGWGLRRRAQAADKPEQVAQATLLLARAWLLARPDSARFYASLALATARPHHLRLQVRDAAQVLAQASDRLRQGHQAYQYQLLASAYTDSLDGEDARRRLAAVQARNLRSRTQNELTLLQQRERLHRQEQELAHLRSQRQLIGLGVGALGAIALVSGLFWDYRRRQQQRAAARDAALRQRLAADLHDDVGSLLTQISLQSDLLRETTAPAAQTVARLERLSDTSRRATRQMADVVWGLHAASADLPEVVAHMRDHAHEVLGFSALAVDFLVSPAVNLCRPSRVVCQNLYLIYKEALHNVVKHAHGASQVTIRVSLEANQLCLSVQNNGIGPAAVARPGGRGLANMRLRAESVGGTLHYTAKSSGFTVVAYLPQ